MAHIDFVLEILYVAPLLAYVLALLRKGGILFQCLARVSTLELTLFFLPLLLMYADEHDVSQIR